MQLEPTLIVLPQVVFVFETANSPGCVVGTNCPLNVLEGWMVTPVSVTGTAWLFWSVTVWKALTKPTETFEKVTDDGDTVMGVVPRPVRSMVCGCPAASSFTTSVPVRVPAIAGFSVT